MKIFAMINTGLSERSPAFVCFDSTQQIKYRLLSEVEASYGAY